MFLVLITVIIVMFSFAWTMVVCLSIGFECMHDEDFVLLD